MLVINEVKATVSEMVRDNISNWTTRTGFVTKFLYHIIARDVSNNLSSKFGVPIDSIKLEKSIPKTTSFSLVSRIMRGLNKMGALTHINAYTILKNYNKGYDLYGRPMSKLDFKAMMENLHMHSRRLVALGARLEEADDSQMNWKTATSLSLLMNTHKMTETQAFYKCQTKYNISTHVDTALKVLSENGLFDYSFSFGMPTSAIVITAKNRQFPPVTEPVPVRSNEKHAEQIEYFTRQIEELNVIIQQQDDEIFRLSNLNDKAKAERHNLMTVLQLLKTY